jgi:hypothetical protein
MINRFLLTLGLVALLLAGCQPQPVAAEPNVVMTAAFETALAQISIPTQTPAPTETPIPTATIPRTPPALPAAYQTSLLKAEDMPRTYLTDACQYLQNKWNPNNSAPGTVVMVIMFHGISKDAATSANQISAQDFKKLMNDLHELGFQAIYMQQMADFIYNNAKIPQRSVLLIVDDRHFAESFNDHFRPYYEKWGWPVINGWISAFGGQDNTLAENVALGQEGWVDYQAHGATSPHTPIDPTSSDSFILHDLQGSKDNIQKYFGKDPIGYIWVGGGFTPHAVELAQKVGYKLGFTVNPRGPVMYNWIPQADTVNPSNPIAIPETPAGNPLMTIPRYWDTDARNKLDDIRQISDQAAQYAEQNKAIELEYYDIVCAPTYGPIPSTP